MATDEKTILGSQPHPQTSRRRVRRRFIIIGAVAMVLAIALAVGLGVGLTVGRPTGSSNDDSAPADSSATPNAGSNDSNVPAAVWKPISGLSWQLYLQGAVDGTNNNGIDVWDIDMFDNEASTIKALQDQGSKVVCYFSAGSYENWRPDKDDFQPDDLGGDLDGWPGEKWLNIKSDNVHKIMEARLDMAKQKGCDAVDPDNVDGFNNDENGLGLTAQDSVDYMAFLASAAHDRNLAIGLKNAGSIIPDVLNQMQFSVNEQCLQYDECDVFRPFIEQDKPVFHVEYPKGDDTNNNDSVASSKFTDICDSSSSQGFSTIIKNMDLDRWIEECSQGQSQS